MTLFFYEVWCLECGWGAVDVDTRPRDTDTCPDCDGAISWVGWPGPHTILFGGNE